MAGGNGHWKYREVGSLRNGHFLLKCFNSFIKHSFWVFFFHSDVREMRNLLSKLRDTMPLPLKNQGAVIFHWWTSQHWGKIPSTHTHTPPLVATAAHIAVRLSWKRLWKKSWLWSLFNVYLFSLRPLKTKVIFRISKKCCADKMAAVSKKRLERPLLVGLNYQLPLSWAEVWVNDTKRYTGNDTTLLYIIYIYYK